MSHFLVGVILPKDSKDETELDGLLEPYSESINVAPYYEKCWCVGSIAKKEAREHADKVAGTIDELRDKYNKLPEGMRPEWKDWLKPYELAEETALKLHPLKNKADKTCEDCHGKGKRLTSYNPNSKWDWWEVGGRWTGAFSDYDPYKDPDNYETCNLCNGTGKRNDQLGKEARAKDPSYTCNGCSGKGKSIKFRLKNKDNLVTVNSLLKRKDLENRIPFAFITPDGVWHEKGEMGWFGMAHNEKDEKKWTKQGIGLLKKYRGHNIVAVDCHI